MKSLEGFTLFLIQILIHAVITQPCHRAEYLIEDECCPMCPAGTWVNKRCTAFRSTSCLPCDEDTYMDEPTGMTQCFSCRSCASGSGLKVKTACSSFSNAVCKPQEGHFCVEPLKDGNCEAAQRHRSCEPGQYIQQPGSASADTVCSPCDEGTFSDGTLSECQPHTQCETLDKATVKAGTLHSDAKCEERSSNKPLAIGISVVVVLLVIAALVALFYFMKQRKQTSDTDVDLENSKRQPLIGDTSPEDC